MGLGQSKEEIPSEPLNCDSEKQFKVIVEFCNS